MQEMQDAGSNLLGPYNSRWPIPEDLPEVLNIALTY